MKKLLFVLIVLISISIIYCTNNTPITVNSTDTITIYVNYHEHSGKQRFKVYKNDSLILESLCMHGKGRNSTMSTPEFSNEVGSNCSSIGKFLVSKKSVTMSSGLTGFLLIGLDPTNNKSVERGLYLHGGIPINIPIYPIYLPLCNLSKGCVTISNSVFSTLEEIINSTDNPVYLYCY